MKFYIKYPHLKSVLTYNNHLASLQNDEAGLKRHERELLRVAVYRKYVDLLLMEEELINTRPHDMDLFVTAFPFLRHHLTFKNRNIGDIKSVDDTDMLRHRIKELDVKKEMSRIAWRYDQEDYTVKVVEYKKLQTEAVDKIIDLRGKTFRRRIKQLTPSTEIHGIKRLARLSALKNYAYQAKISEQITILSTKLAELGAMEINEGLFTFPKEEYREVFKKYYSDAKSEYLAIKPESF